MSIRRLAVAAISLLAVVGCSTTIVGDDPSTGLDVEVVKGPIQPVQREGEVNELPVGDALVRVRGADGGSAALRTDEQGRAGVSLVPGAYEVRVETCPGALALPEPEPVEVRRGERSEVRLSCDTGIR